MQLPSLTHLSLILILASTSQARWSIDVTRNITATLDSNIIIPCTFTYPSSEEAKNVNVYWKTRGKSVCSENDKDRQAFIFHWNDTCVLKKYRNKTKLIGNAADGNCSLKILNIRDNMPNIYVRASAHGQNYSFFKQSVHISVKGVTQVSSSTDYSLPIFETTAGPMNPVTSKTMYMSIFVPVAALLLVALAAGIFTCIKRKRSQTVTREESGYYANFSRASSNPQREVSCKIQDKNLPELKAIDDPIYINVEAPAGQMNQRADHTENIYGNVDYS